MLLHSRLTNCVNYLMISDMQLCFESGSAKPSAKCHRSSTFGFRPFFAVVDRCDDIRQLTVAFEAKERKI